jgi:hypothetical protein
MPGVLHYELILHNTSRDNVDHDISIFFRHEVGKIKDEFEELPAGWPGYKTINLLVKRADGLFIYAATVCRFIKRNEQWSPQDLLDLIVSNDSANNLLKRKRSEVPH